MMGNEQDAFETPLEEQMRDRKSRIEEQFR
jgi:hypothetical protein